MVRQFEREYLGRYILRYILLYITGTLSAGEFRNIECDNVHTGRFVAIYFNHSGALTVCEFEVFGGKFLCRFKLFVQVSSPKNL